jgi:PKD domain-containing protein
MLRAMLRYGHDASSPKHRLRLRGAAPLRGGLVAVASLTAVLALGAAGALADSSGGSTGISGASTGSSGASSQTVSTPAPEGPLEVTMSASPQVALVGQTVTYTAQVSGAPPGRQILYHWAFEGGTGTGEQISRSYPDPGEYPVAVTVTVASVAGLSGVADQLTVVDSPAPPSKAPAAGGSAGGGRGSGTGKGGDGTGSGPSHKAATHAARHPAKAAAAAGVTNPLAVQAPSAQAGDQVEGFLLTDAGVPFVAPTTPTPTAASTGSGGSAAGLSGVGGAAGIGGGLALTIAIVTLGALDERRRISLRTA